MRKLFYINDLEYDLNVLNRYYCENDDVIVFTPSEVLKNRWAKKYKIYSYTDLNIDASLNVFQDFPQLSYRIADKIIQTCAAIPSLTNKQDEVLQCLSGKIHRVLAECMKSEKVVSMILEKFDPNIIYMFEKEKALFSEIINTKVNFEQDIFLQHALKNQKFEIVYLKNKKQNSNTVNHISNLIKNNLKKILYKSKYWYKSLMMKPLELSDETYILIYVHRYYFERFLQLFEYCNKDLEHNYLVFGDNFNDKKQRLLKQKYPNLNFYFFSGNYPTVKLKSSKFDLNIQKLVYEELRQHKFQLSTAIISLYMSEFLNGYFDEYIQNNEIIEKTLNGIQIEKAIFLSFWDVQQAMFIKRMNQKNLITYSLQTGFSYFFAGEKTFAKFHAVYGERELTNITNLFEQNSKVFILGWLQKKFYEKLKMERNSELVTKDAFLFLFSMSGSWQNFVYFPEDLIIMDILKVAKEFPQYKFILRGRIGDDIGAYLSMDEFKNIKNIIIDTNFNLIDTFNEVDCVFTQSTTAGFEAITYGLPTFYLALHALNDGYPLYDISEKYIVYNKQSLKNIVNKFKNSSVYMDGYWDSVEKLVGKTFYEPIDFSRLIR